MNLTCANCDWEGTDEQTKPASDIEERHTIGCIYSDQECPECGALCYPTDPSESFPWSPFVTYKNDAEKRVHEAAPDLLAALEAIVARERGEFDNPHLLAHGPLSSKTEDILAIARAAIAQAKGDHQ